MLKWTIGLVLLANFFAGHAKADEAGFRSGLNSILAQATTNSWSITVNENIQELTISSMNEPTANTQTYLITVKEISTNTFYDFVPLLSSELNFTVKPYGNTGTYRVTIPQGAEFPLELMKEVPFIESIEVEFTIELSEGTQNLPTNGDLYGLDRIDTNALALNNVYNYPGDGSDVIVYIVDTGINTQHVEFQGRLMAGYSALNTNTSVVDCQGHGTHVAGTVMGATTGVAKGALVSPIRVFACSGGASNADIIEGIDWAISDRQKQGKRAVMNMSLGGGLSTAINAAVTKATSNGIVVVVAAGNENQNACNVSPASAPSAITVASSTNTDARSSFSNFGTCVDIFAPGSNIYSSYFRNSRDYVKLSGTSMASPHVAGAAAVLLQLQPTLSVSQVAQVLVASATSNVITDAQGSPNKLLFMDPKWIQATETPTEGPSTTPPPVDDGTGDGGNGGAFQCVAQSMITKCGAADQNGYVMTSAGVSSSGGRMIVSALGEAGVQMDLYLLSLENNVYKVVSSVTKVAGDSSAAPLALSYYGKAGNYVALVRRSDRSTAFDAQVSLIGSFVNQQNAVDFSSEDFEADAEELASSGSSSPSTGLIIAIAGVATVVGVAVVVAGTIYVVKKKKDEARV